MSDPNPLSAGDSTAYIDSLLAYLGERDPLDVFASTPAALRDQTLAVPENVLAIPEAPGKWSILNVVQHYCQVEFALGFRYRIALAEEAPVLPAIDQDRWIAGLYPGEVGLEEALADFEAVRTVNLHLLRRVHGEDWERFGMHSQRGKESMKDMVRLYAAHDLYHLHQIGRIYQAVAG